MRTIVPIVEGDGEVQAFPVLLRRIAAARPQGSGFQVAKAIRVRRDRFINRPDEMRRMMLLAAAKAGPQGRVIVLLDADDDCPADLGARLQSEVSALVSHISSAVVLANREYEAWFIAAAASIDGVRGFSSVGVDIERCELTRNAKGAMGRHMPGGHYSPISDQAAFSERLDLDQARTHSRSFRKLLSSVDALLR
jgi:Domain of unknown function (DUF4276)